MQFTILKWYIAALFCGLVPLLVGCGLFLTWLTTRNDWLVFTGLALTYPLALMLIAGFGAVVIFVRRARHHEASYKWKAAGAAGLLLGNIPAAMAMAYAAHLVLTAFVVITVNGTSKPIKALIVRDPYGQEFNLGEVMPRNASEHRLHFRGEGAVTYRLKLEDKDRTGLLFGYVTSNMGGRARLLVAADGTISVTP